MEVHKLPLYTYKCPICDEVKDQFNTIAGRNDGPMCCDTMELVIMPTQLQPVLGGGDFPGYYCVVTDKFVTSRKERRNIMAKHNLVETS